ncbi:MAG: hypothetical protein MZU91_10090 [Desulfosudis oleivorans]|nr:hypothetical protein [Desulfosudis oleivorans]
MGITLPFPGNLYAGLKCAQYIKKHFPLIKIVAGGGFVNTELRDLSEPAIFDYLDFITLDDGERPFLSIVEFLQGKKNQEELTRTFIRMDDEVRYIHDGREPDFSHAETGCPDYSDLLLDKYLSLIEMANPMHRLWSDGCWNKLTIAHGCYWHQCSFCDTTLPYINRYESAPAVSPGGSDRTADCSNRTPRFSFCGRGCAASGPEKCSQRIAEKKNQDFLVDEYPL